MPLPLVPIIAAGAPLLIRWLSVAFIAGLVARIIAAMGLSYFAFTGIDNGLDALQIAVNDSLTGMPFDVKQLLDMAGITTTIFWIIHAHAFGVLVRVSKFALYRRKSFI